MPKQLFINPKVIKQYSEDKGTLYLSIKKIEPKEVLFRIPISETLYAPRDDSVGLFTYPLIDKLVNSPSWVNKYYTHDEYKTKSPMYVPIQQLEQTCAKHGMCFQTIVIRFLISLHILNVLTFTLKDKPFDLDEFNRVLHAYHIVDSRCVADKNTNNIHLVPYFDDMNHSKRPNVSYKFDTKSMVIKAVDPIKMYTELEVSYGTDSSKEKIFGHYYFIEPSAPSVSLYKDDDFHAHSLIKMIDECKDISVYEFYKRLVSDEESKENKIFVYHMEMLLRS